MILKLLRLFIIYKMDNAGMGDELQNHFLSALGLREKKKSCVVLTPYFGNNTSVGMGRQSANNLQQNNQNIEEEKEILTEGEFFMYPDWMINSSSIFNRQPKLNKNLSDSEILLKMLDVLV